MFTFSITAAAGSSNTAPVGWDPGLQNVKNLGHVSNFGGHKVQDFLTNRNKQQKQQVAAAAAATAADTSYSADGTDYGDGGGGNKRHRQHSRRPSSEGGDVISERRAKGAPLGAAKKANSDTEDGHENSDSPFGPIVPINSSDYQDTFRCQFYNKTLCTLSNGREGCGESAIVCSSHGALSNVNPLDSPALCYALWSNTSDGIVVTYKGCWIGQASACSPNANDVCLERGAPKTHLSLLFCCCAGSLCNSEVQHIPPAEPNHPPEAGESSINQRNGEYLFFCCCCTFFLLRTLVERFLQRLDIFNYPKSNDRLVSLAALAPCHPPHPHDLLLCVCVCILIPIESGVVGVHGAR